MRELIQKKTETRVIIFKNIPKLSEYHQKEAFPLYVIKISNRYSIIYFLLTLITVLIITAWLVHPFSPEDYETLLTISGFIIFTIFGLILLAFVLKFNIQAQARKAWLLIAAAMFSWALGELAQIISNYLLQVDQPLLWGTLRLTGYAIFFLGLIMQWRTLEVQVKRVEVVLLVLLFGACLAIILTLILDISLIDMDSLTQTIQVTVFPIMDLLLTFISGVILWKVKRTKIVFPWIVLTLLLVNNMILNWQQ
ncbi:MAG: hypothetical protein ACFFC6_01105, partial [Promethearchaeota archaeon]